MRKSRFTEEQLIAILSEQERGLGTAAERTAGLYIFEKSISFTRLLDPDLPKGWWSDLWRLQLGETAKALTGQSLYGGVDPLVLDLHGIGGDLSARAALHGADRTDVA